MSGQVRTRAFVSERRGALLFAAAARPTRLLCAASPRRAAATPAASPCACGGTQGKGEGRKRGTCVARAAARQHARLRSLQSRYPPNELRFPASGRPPARP